MKNIVNYLIDNQLINVESEEADSLASEENDVIHEQNELMEQSFNEENKQEFLQPSPK